ncbi:MAG: hypothetical protein GXO92_03595 [FCB group bacterium]|nr:hypothetical protein [FCB group bacterium]
MKRLTMLLIIFLINGLILTSCEDNKDTKQNTLGASETEAAIIGNWIHEVVANYNYAGLSLLDDGTYYYVNMTSPTEEPHTIREGTYTIDGKTLTLGYDNASCEGDGVYDVSITEDTETMTLKKTSDDCEVRAGELPGEWQLIVD